MSIIDKLIASLKFKKSSKFIIKRLNELNGDLEVLDAGIDFITNDFKDAINYVYLDGCLELKSDCRFSLELLKGKIKVLKPVTTKQEEIKKEILQWFNKISFVFLF